MHIRIRFLAAITLVACLTSMAQGRTWTSREGKQIEADFVDIDEQRVTLKLSSGRESVIKLDLLCDDDQQYLRGVYARRKAKSSTITDDDTSKSAINLNAANIDKSDDSSDDSDAEPSPGKSSTKPINRTWTDLQGKQITGKFIRVQGSTVVLLRGGRQTTTDYWQLTSEDQDYVKEILEAKGQASLIPTVRPNNAIAGNALGNGGMGAGAMPMIPNAAMPNFVPPASMPAHNPAMASMPRSTFPGATMPGASYPGPSYPGASPPMNSYPGSSVASSMPPPNYPGASYPGASYPGTSMPSSTMPGSSMPAYVPPAVASMPNFSMPQQVQVKICEGCKKQVPDSIGAGDHCPHCGVYFSYDTTTGKKANTFGNLSIRGGAGLVKLVIVGVMALFGVGAAAVSAMSGIFKGKKPQANSDW